MVTQRAWESWQLGGPVRVCSPPGTAPSDPVGIPPVFSGGPSLPWVTLPWVEALHGLAAHAPRQQVAAVLDVNERADGAAAERVGVPAQGGRTEAVAGTQAGRRWQRSDERAGGWTQGAGAACTHVVSYPPRPHDQAPRNRLATHRKCPTRGSIHTTCWAPVQESSKRNCEKTASPTAATCPMPPSPLCTS